MNTSRAFRYLLLGSAVAVTLAACDRGNKDKQADNAAIVAEVDGPLSYESVTPYAKVSLTLPEGIRGYPNLYKTLYDSETTALKEYSEGAQSDRSEFGSNNLPPYEKSIIYSEAVETGRLFSMMRTDFDYSGGAHPNTTATGVLWDRTNQKQLAIGDLFATDADKAALNRLLCDAVNQAKTGREGAIALSKSDGTWTCPDANKVPVVLAASQTAGKASGLTFLLDPYAVGPYVEGPYYLTIPFTALGNLIRPDYVGEFGGTGTTGDVTNAVRPDVKPS